MQAADDLLVVSGGHRGDVDDGEAVEERAGQTLPPAALRGGVLRREEAEVRVADDLEAELGDEDGPAVVEQRVETLKDALRREVQTVEQEPVPAADGLDEHALLEDKAPVWALDVAPEVLLDSWSPRQDLNTYFCGSSTFGKSQWFTKLGNGNHQRMIN